MHIFDEEADEAWDRLLELGVPEETLQVVIAINGYSLDTLKDVLFAVEGYRSFDQIPENI